MTTEHVKCLIIGSGPAGYTAAIYTSRANLSPVLYEGIQPGGQLTITTEVENFPGYPEGVTGPVLMDDLRKQAERFGADIRNGIVTKADLSQAPYHFIIDDEKEITADTVIISTGATAKYLDLEDSRWWRYSLRRSHLSGRSRQTSIPGSPQTILTCLKDYAGTRTEPPKH